MTLSMIQIGKDLKEMLLHKEKKEDIGRWAWSVYYKNMRDLNKSNEKILTHIYLMEEGEQFYLPYETLNKIAEDLIMGKEVDLNSPEYRENITQKKTN